MNTSDPSAERVITARAPILRAWLETLHRRGAAAFDDGDEPAPAAIEVIAPLLAGATSLKCD